MSGTRSYRLVLALIAAVTAFAGCGRASDAPREGKDLVTLQSPDGHFNAKVQKVDIDGSVMVSQPFQVLVESLVEGDRWTQVALIADKTDPLRIHWTGPSTLIVCYSTAHISNFRNYFTASSYNSPDVYETEIMLVKRKESSPCDRSTLRRR